MYARYGENEKMLSVKLHRFWFGERFLVKRSREPLKVNAFRKSWNVVMRNSGVRRRVNRGVGIRLFGVGKVEESS